MTSTTPPPQQPGPITDLSNSNKKFEDPIKSAVSSHTAPTQTTRVDHEEVTLPQPCQGLESTAHMNLPFTMERYLDEPPKAGGPTCGLINRSRHQNILNILSLVDKEFEEGETRK